MDPFTHALLGATSSQAAFGSRLGRHAWMIGAAGALLPDVDFFISSAADPLLAIEYHRHFTHSFAFIPVGGLIASLPWLLQKRYRANWLAVYTAASIGYATHGLLDACTNYGTHLLWPFSEVRTAWHWITTIGPLFTLMLLVGLVFAVRGRSRLPAVAAVALCLAYVGTAAMQRERALDVQAHIASSRGHAIARAEMFPTIGNPFVWRSVYQSNETLYSDRVRVMATGAPLWKEGSEVALLHQRDLLTEAQADERVSRDFGRFSYFSAGWVARAQSDPGVIGDARYSLQTDTFEPVWGVRFHPGKLVPTEWVDRTGQNRIPLRELWTEISGGMPGYRPVPPAVMPAL